MKKFVVLIVCGLCSALSAQDLEKTLGELGRGDPKSEDVTRAMEPWLDEGGFDKLRAALQESAKHSAAEWQAVALIEERLLRLGEAVEAWEKACASKTGVTASMRVGLAKVLSSVRKYAEAVKAFDGMDDAALDTETADQALRVLLAISKSSGSDRTALERARTLANARPADQAVQISLFQFEAPRGDAREKLIQIQERLAEAPDVLTRHRWRSLLIQIALNAGLAAEAATHVVEGLADTNADSNEEAEMLREFESAWTRRQPRDKMKATAQEIAAQFEQRPGVVRAMAAVLREEGSTAEALQLLAKLPDNPQAQKLIANWAEEDGRAAENVTAKTLAPVEEVATPDAPQAWRQEVREMTGGALLKRLLELRRKAPQDQEIAMALMEAWSANGRQAEAQHEIHRMELDVADDGKRGAWAQRVASRSGRIVVAVVADSPEWQEVQADLQEGRPQAAARAMFERAGDAALSAELAAYLSTGLMAWHEWQDAATFLAAQCRRFPLDYRLACLHGIALKGAGDLAGAEAAFLALGGFEMEIRRDLPPRDTPATATEAEQWMLVSGAVNAALHYEVFLARWIESREGVRPEELHTVAPTSVQQAGAWGMAHLMALSSERAEAERRALIERATAAKLPFPGLLLAGKIEFSEVGGNTLMLDPEWVKDHLDEAWVAAIWLTQVAQRPRREGDHEAATADAAQLQELAAMWVEKLPQQAFRAAVLAWMLDPALDVTELLVATVPKGETGGEQLVSALIRLPLEARRKAAAALMPVLPGSGDLSGLGALLLGRWKEAAERINALPEAKMNLPTQESRMPAWMGNSGSSPLAWPPPHLGGILPYLGGGPWLLEEEKTAFLAVADQIKRPRAKAAWQLAGGDEEGAKATVKSWAQAEPHSLQAVLTLACFEAHERKLDEALDLLDGLIQKQADAEARLEALSIYLLAGVNRSNWSDAAADPPPAHRQGLKDAALELLPHLKKWAGLYADSWARVFAALDLKEEAEALAPSVAHDFIAFERYMEQMLAEVASRPRREQRREFSPHQIKDLVASGKTAQAVELTLRSLRRMADWRFLGSLESSGMSDPLPWRQAISESSLAEAIMTAAQPGESPSWRRLVQAVHAAEACGDWQQMEAFAEAAQRLDGSSKALNLALLAAKFRLANDPAVLVDGLRGLPREEAHRVLALLLEQANRDANFPLRMLVAQAALRLAVERPEIMQMENGRNQALPSLFSLLSDPNRREYVPIPSEEDLAVRHRLHAELCDLSLKHPEWADSSVEALIQRNLVEKQPQARVLTDYIRRAMGARLGRAGTLVSLGLSFGQSYSGEERLRLAQIILPLLSDLPEDGDQSSGVGRGFTDLIGDEVSSEQSSPNLNEERRALMDELWQAVQRHENLRREVYPAWAGYRLHFLESPTEVLVAARTFKDVPDDPYLLRAFMKKATLATLNTHHILSAEFVAGLLGGDADLIQHESSAKEAGRVIDLLLSGRPGQGQSMPPITLPDDEAKLVLAEKWLARRRIVLAQLTRLFLETNFVPPVLLFYEMERSVIAGEGIQDSEKHLLELAELDAPKVLEQLGRHLGFVTGTLVSDNAYKGGIWELGKRLQFFESMLRIGKRTLKEASVGSGPEDGWLSDWIRCLGYANKQSAPMVPPLRGMERGTGWIYPQVAPGLVPLLQRREDLLMQGLELAMLRPQLWSKHFATFTFLQMSRHGREGAQRVAAVLDLQAKENPASLPEGMRTWERDFIFPDTESRLAAAEMMAKHLPQIAQANDLHGVVTAWRRVLLGTDDNGQMMIPLVPDKRWMIDDYGRIDRDMREEGSKERLAAWRLLLEQMESYPALAMRSFQDQLRLHVEQGPERLMKMTVMLDDEQWFEAENSMASLYAGGEARSTTGRRAAWGKVALLWQQEAAKRLARSPERQNSRRWPKVTLEFLRADWKPDPSETKPPQPNTGDVEQRDAVVRDFEDLLAAKATVSTEGFKLFARRQFSSGQPSQATLKIAQDSLQRDPVALSRQLDEWCREIANEKTLPAEECEWAGGILLKLADAWPVEQDMPWVGVAAWMMGKRAALDASAKDSANALYEKFVDRTFQLGKPAVGLLPTYAWFACRSSAGRDKLVGRLIRLAGEDVETAASCMLSWLGGFSTSGGNLPTEDEANAAMTILKQWPKDTAPATLEWAEGLAFGAGLEVNKCPVRLKRAKDGVTLPENIPAPSLDLARQRIQLNILQELEERGVSYPWMLPLSLRLAGHASLDDTNRVRQLTPFFDDKRRPVTINIIRHFLGVDLAANQAYYESHGSRHPARSAPVPDADAEQVLDASRILQTAIGEDWINADEAASLKKTNQQQLAILVDQGARNARKPERMNVFGFVGVLPAQGVEAKRLLDTWNTVPKADNSAMLTPSEIPGVLRALLEDNTDTATIANRIWKVVIHDPQPSAEALEQWAQQVRDGKDFPAYLGAGKLAVKLAQRWTPDLPAPDWLPIFLKTWRLGNFEGKWTAACTTDFTAEANLHLPALHDALCRFPGCRFDTWIPVMLSYAQSTKTNDAELASLVLANLRAQRDGSIPVTRLPRYYDSPDVLHGPKFHRDAILFLFDHLATTQDHDWWEKECRPVLDRVLQTSARLLLQRVERVAACPPDEFAPAVTSILADNYTDGFAWALRTAVRRKITIDMDLWLKIMGAPSRENIDLRRGLMLDTAQTWLQTREFLGHDAVADLREFLRAVLADDYGSPEMKLTLRAHMQEGVWSGWPRFRSPLVEKPVWRFAYELIESLATNSSGHFRAVLEVSDEIGLDAVKGYFGYLLARRPDYDTISQAQAEWKRVLVASGLMSSTLDPIWLLPRDGHLPILELADRVWLKLFISKTSSGSIPAPGKWLEDESLERPTLGTALLLLARDYRSRQGLPVDKIEALLTPCRRDLQSATEEQRSALSTALHFMQPEMSRAVKLRDADSVLNLLPAPISDSSRLLARSWLARTTSKSDASVEVKKRLQPFATDMLELLISDNDQTREVMQHGISLLAAEEWNEVLPRGMQREEWLYEFLGASMVDVARSSKITTEVRIRRCEALVRFLVQHAGKFTCLLSDRAITSLLFVQLFSGPIKSAKSQAAQILRLLPSSPGPDVLLLLPAFSYLDNRVAVEEALPLEQRGSWLSWALLHQANPEAPMPAGTVKDDWSPAVLMRIANFDGDRLSESQRINTLKNWTYVTLSLGEHSSENSFDYRSLRWLDVESAHPSMSEEISEAAAAMAVWLQMPRSGWSYSSLGGRSNIAQCIISPLLGALNRSGKHEQRLDLLRAAAFASRLSLNDLLHELRAASDIVAACKEWLPLYFHSEIDAGRRIWAYDLKGLPLFTTTDVPIFNALDQAGLDESCRLTAALVFAFMRDDTSQPPSVPRSQRVSKALKGIDQTNLVHLTAVNRLIAITGAAESALADILPTVRRHPVVVDWREHNRLSFESNYDADKARTRAARVLGITAASEALTSGDDSMWNQWIQAIAKGLEPDEGKRSPNASATSPAKQWAQHARSVLTSIQEQWMIEHPAEEWARLLPLWDALEPDVAGTFLADYATELRIRIALAKNTPKGKEEARTELKGYRWHRSDTASGFVIALLCDPPLVERVAFLSSPQSADTMPYQSVLIRNANKVGFMNAKHWIQAIPEVPVMSLAPLAGALIDWMNDRDDDAGVLLLAGRLTELEADALKPFVWSKMLKAAQSVGDAPLEAKLRAKIR